MQFRSQIWCLAGAAAPFLLVCSLAAQTPEPPNLQQKIAQIQQDSGKNKELLRDYQWTETTTITIDGNQRPPRVSLCRYGPDGTVEKTPMGGQDTTQQGQMGGMGPRGMLVRKLIAGRKKKAIEKEVADIRSVAKMYIPLDREKLKAAFAAGRVTIEGGDANGEAIVIRDYAKKGDEVTLALAPATKKIESVAVKSYLDHPKDKLTGEVEFSRLENGARYAGVTSIAAPSKNISITIVNSNYAKIAD